MSDLLGKLQLIGEWANGSLEVTEDRRMLDMKMLNEALHKKVYEADLQFLLTGLMIILGIHKEEDEFRYTLEIRVPLVLEEGAEYDLALLEQRGRGLKDLQDRGFYLVGDKDGHIRCYKEGAAEALEQELTSIETALAV